MLKNRWCLIATSLCVFVFLTFSLLNADSSNSKKSSSNQIAPSSPANDSNDSEDSELREKLRTKVLAIQCIPLSPQLNAFYLSFDINSKWNKSVSLRSFPGSTEMTTGNTRNIVIMSQESSNQNVLKSLGIEDEQIADTECEYYHYKIDMAHPAGKCHKRIHKENCARVKLAMAYCNTLGAEVCKPNTLWVIDGPPTCPK
jgi:hypothetical protein